METSEVTGETYDIPDDTGKEEGIDKAEDQSTQ